MVNRLFVDTNIALDILFSDRENSEKTKAFIMQQNSKLVINDLSLNTIFYIGSKINYDKTIEFLKTIVLSNSLWEVYYLKKADFVEVFKLMDENNGADFEDLQQYISANNSNCKTIITNDKNFPKLNTSLKRTAENIDDFIINH